MHKHPQSSRSPVASTTTELLIKNLRLLDLDEEFDWPKIRPDTFAAADAVQNQRNRVYCAQWALFKLLEIWDPKEAESKDREIRKPRDRRNKLLGVATDFHLHKAVW